METAPPPEKAPSPALLPRQGGGQDGFLGGLDRGPLLLALAAGLLTGGGLRLGLVPLAGGPALSLLLNLGQGRIHETLPQDPSVPVTDFYKPNPLDSDVIMDATARLLAPRRPRLSLWGGSKFSMG